MKRLHSTGTALLIFTMLGVGVGWAQATTDAFSAINLTATPSQSGVVPLIGTDIASLSSLTEAQLTAVVTTLDATPAIPADGVPVGGTFWSLQNPNMPPLPCDGIGVSVWQLSDGSFLLNDLGYDHDTLSALATSRSMTMNASIASLPSPGDGGSDTNYTSGYSSSFATDYGTNLWIAQTAVASNQMTGIISNSAPGVQLELQFKTDLLQPWQSANWFFFGTDGTNWTPWNVPTISTSNLFLRARSWADTTGNGIPDWWQLQYFGSVGIDPYGNPRGDGFNNLYKYEHGMNPNVFYTPAAPQAVTANYNASNATITVTWLPVAGSVTNYLVMDSNLGSVNVGANQSSITFSVPNLHPYSLLNGGPNIALAYRVQALYTQGVSGVSAWAGLGGYAPSVPVQLIQSGNGTVYLSITPTAVPTMTTAVRLTRVDFWPAYLYGSGSAFTNFDIPVTAFTNGLFPIPAAWQTHPMDPYGYAYYRWWAGTLNANKSPNSYAMLLTAGYDFSQTNSWMFPPFFDGRAQLKQNLIFQLRDAVFDSPFSMREFNDDYYGPQVVTTSYPNGYAFAGFFDFSNSANGTYNPLLPFVDNYKYRNYAFNVPDLNTDGSLIGLAADYYSRGLVEPQWYQFRPPETNQAVIAPLLDATSASRWLDTGLNFYANVTQSTPPVENYSEIAMIVAGYEPGVPKTMAGSISNLFGLPFVSTKVAWGASASQTATLYPGNTVTNDNFFYTETGQPKFRTDEYDFWSSTDTILPGDPHFQPTNSTPYFLTTVGSPIKVVGYAKLEVTNSCYTGVYGYLGQYFDQAYEVNGNGSVTSTNTGIVSPYGDFFPTAPGLASLVTMPDLDTSARGTCMVYSVSMQMDKNHDGNMDTTYNGPDATSQASPMVFWVNDDCDWSSGSGDAYTGHDINNPNLPDYQSLYIRSHRDLEDFARLWICGLPALTNSSYQVTLSMSTVSGNPAVNLVSAVETNGGTLYLTDTNVAAAQVDYTGLGMYGYPGYKFARITPSQSYTFPSGYFTNAGNKYFLFEGAGVGKGQLMLRISQNGQIICQTGIWLDLHDVKDLYEQAHILGGPTTFPEMVQSTNLSSTLVPDHEMPSTLTESNQLVVFVHGWRMSVWDYYSFSETMFKRLYWTGYQGRFASLRWPTLSSDDYLALSDLMSYTTFNRSEYMAHRSADAASDYFNWLKSRLPNYSINAVAHSMGNTLMMETLKEQLAGGSHSIDNYVMMQAAVPAHCYDPSLANYGRFTADEADSPTPDIYRGFPGNIAAAVNGQIVNFFNTNDYALATGSKLGKDVSWEANQDGYKPDWVWQYWYDGTNCYRSQAVPKRVTDPREQMSFVARPRSKAVGALGGVGGQVSGGQVDLKAKFGFDRNSYEHSAEFNYSIQQLGGTNGFYKQLGTSLNVFPLFTP